MSRKHNWLSFEEAHAIVLRDAKLYGIDTAKKWDYQRIYGYNRPLNIPVQPWKIYKDKGWVSWGHWLGTGNRLGALRTYNVNDGFFKTWSHDMSYILGFWFADGCISGGTFRIDQHKDDKYILCEILRVMGSNYMVGTHKNMSRLSIRSKEIIDSIKGLGGKERKSLNVKFPSIPKKYLSDFIRGNFDGDGCIVYNKHDGTYESGFCSGSKDFIYGLFHCLKGEIPNLGGRIEKKIDNGGYSGSVLYLIRFGKNDTIRLKKFMYGSPSSLFLKRKHDLFEKTGEITKLKNKQNINYAEAIKYARSLRLKSRTEWLDFCKSGKKRYDVPSNPPAYYKNKGWVSWGKWLGTNRIADQFRVFMPFHKAIKIVRRDVVKYNFDWAAYRRKHKNKNIPSHPDVSYKNKGWISWSHFFGRDENTKIT